MYRNKCSHVNSEGLRVEGSLSSSREKSLSLGRKAGKPMVEEMHDADIRAYLRFRLNEHLALVALSTKA
jgi:hypothetical protein